MLPNAKRGNLMTATGKARAIARSRDLGNGSISVAIFQNELATCCSSLVSHIALFSGFIGVLISRGVLICITRRRESELCRCLPSHIAGTRSAGKNCYTLNVTDHIYQ